MIKHLERLGILNFHPEIKTEQQKKYALIYATGVVLIFTVVVFTITYTISRWCA